MPSSLRLYEAPVGQTGTQGGSSQCRQDLGKCTVSVFGKVPTSNVCTRLKKVPVGLASYGLKSLIGPAGPEVFHSLQLVTHALQPTHTFRSMTRANCVISSFLPQSRPASCSGVAWCRDKVSWVQIAAMSVLAHQLLQGRCARARQTTRPGR